MVCKHQGLEFCNIKERLLCLLLYRHVCWPLQIKRPSSKSSVLASRHKIFIPLMKVSKCVPCLCLCTISKHSTANNQISQSNEVSLDWPVRQQCSHFVSRKVLGYKNFSQFCFVRCYFFVIIFGYIVFYLYLFVCYTPILICASFWKQPLAGAFIVL